MFINWTIESVSGALSVQIQNKTKHLFIFDEQL